MPKFVNGSFDFIEKGNGEVTKTPNLVELNDELRDSEVSRVGESCHIPRENFEGPSDVMVCNGKVDLVGPNLMGPFSYQACRNICPKNNVAKPKYRSHSQQKTK